MSALTFTLKNNIDYPIDCRLLIPDLLKDKTNAEIQSIEIGKHTVADLFDVSGDDAKQVMLKNTNKQLHYIGHQMKEGLITIDGDVGDYLGAAMQGGILICKGSAGERAADLMRRGILLIEGDAGEYCASRMRAGTVGVMGKTGAHLGFGMKRGTLLLAQTPLEQATWLDCGIHTLPFLNILYQSFQQLDSKFATIKQNRVKRYMGDASGMGKAELLILQG